MAKSEVVTLRISEETKEQLEKVFGEDITTSDMIRNTIFTYLKSFTDAEKGIVPIELPIRLLDSDDLKKLYKDICDIENKVTDNIIKLGYNYDLDYLKVIQNAKNLLVSYMSINNGREENKKSIEKLNEKLEAAKAAKE